MDYENVGNRPDEQIVAPDDHNTDPKPFCCKADSDKIIAAAIRRRQMLDSIRWEFCNCIGTTESERSH